MKKLILFIAIAGALLFYGKIYGIPAQNAESSNGNASNNKRGAEIYFRKCMACHQVNGAGLPGTFPPLKGSDFLKSATKARLINQVMNGSKEHLVVNGTTYTTPMPPQVDNAKDAVAVINYILNSWGNHYGHATLQDTKKVKPVKKSRNNMMMGGGHGMMMGNGNMSSGNMGNMNMSQNTSAKSQMSKKNPIIKKGVINVNAIDKNHDGKLYEDVMDWNVISDKPGTCPICGMKLREFTIQQVKENLKKHGFKYK